MYWLRQRIFIEMSKDLDLWHTFLEIITKETMRLGEGESNISQSCKSSITIDFKFKKKYEIFKLQLICSELTRELDFYQLV